MLRNIDLDSDAGPLTLAINHVLIDHGPAGLSLRRIGQYAKMSPSTMLHHYRSRERLLRVAAITTTKARLETVRWELRSRGVGGLLPAAGDDRAMLGARAWLAWLEMWRTTTYVEPLITRARDEELDLLAGALDHQLTRPALTSIYALADGLAVAVGAPDRPMYPGAAEEALEQHARDLLRRSPQPLSPSRQLRLLRGLRAPEAA